MKRSVAILGSALIALARAAGALPGNSDEPPPPGQDNDDYRGFPDDPLDTIRSTPLGGSAWLGIGGQHRLRYELIEGQLEGLTPRSSVMLVRNLLHLDFHAARQLRLFVQAGSHAALGDPSAQPPDANLFDVTQALLEAEATLGGITFTARVGRQQMGLGSTRWVSVRDGTNVRQAFDLVRLSLASRSWSSETFAGAVPDLKEGALDDRFDASDRFWGSYWTIEVVAQERLLLEAFYMARQRAAAEYDDAAGAETRHMIGTRLDGTLPTGTRFVVHALGQAGSVSDSSVLAWGLAGAIWQHLPAGFRAGLRGDALSGDGRPGDGKLGTFHPFFPNQTFFSALPALYPTNLYDLHPLAQWETETASAALGCVFFFRQSVEDAIYRPPGRPFVPAQSASRQRYSGAQLSASFEHELNPHWTFNAEYSHLFAGPGLVASTRGDIDFFGTWTTLTY